MRFILCGDALFSSRNLAKRLDKRLVKLLQEADGGFVNAEFCTPNPETPPASGRGYTTSVRPATLDEFVDLNLPMVGFVNNHTGDYGWNGVIDTINAAEARKLLPCGVGRNLRHARLPKFLDTPTGRIGLVATGSTRSEVFYATDSGADVVARPGSNPLRWGRAFVLTPDLFEKMKEIDVALGTRASMDEGLRVETFPPQGEDSFKFGSLFEGAMTIEKGEKSYVRTFMNAEDEAENLKSIADAKKRSDICIFSLHTHEGMNENWYSEQVPEFIDKICHEAIDAGADVVVCHGAHFVRGIEVYKNAPIFYNIGSILMEFEAGESIINPEMYSAYGYAVDSRPSDLHANRAKNKAGSWQGFNAEARFSENFLVQLDYNEGKLEWALVPINLRMQAERPLDRGLPVWMGKEEAQAFADKLTEYSRFYGTKLVYCEDGMIRLG